MWSLSSRVMLREAETKRHKAELSRTGKKMKMGFFLKELGTCKRSIEMQTVVGPGLGKSVDLDYSGVY